jgi:hypothetical protein
MLHCNMNTSLAIQFALDDLLADLLHSRRTHDLGRLALLAYCEVRGWARQAGKPDIAESAMKMFTENPCVSKEEFLANIDSLITTLERHQQAYQQASAPYSRSEAASSQWLAQ